MESTGIEEITSDAEDKNPLKENSTELEVGEGDSPPKSATVEPSCSSLDSINNTDNMMHVEAPSINKNKEDIKKQTSPDRLIDTKETGPGGDIEDEFGSDMQEEEIKLRWDDDENSLGFDVKIPSIDISKDSCEDLDEAINEEKSEHLMEIDMAVNNDEEIVPKAGVASVSSSITSQSDSFVETQILNKYEHGVNKPDVMLDIPGMLPDMDEELDSMNVEMFSDSEKDSIPEDTDRQLSELVTRVNTETLSPLEENELDSKLEMSSDIDDEPLENTSTANKTELEQAIENEMKLLSDTISCIDEQDYIKDTPTDLPEVASEDAINESNLMKAINNEVKSLVETISNIEQDDPMENVVLTVGETSPVPSAIAEEENVLEPQSTPSQQREKDMNLKVSSLISSIEEEIQLLDSNDEMEYSEVASACATTGSKIKNVLEKEMVIDLVTSDSGKAKKKSTKIKADLEIIEEVSLVSEIKPKNKELDETELKQKEQDELALAVKAIEQEDQTYESVPAVTLINVIPQEEMSEISVIDEDDQPSISLVLDDDDESIEVQNADPMSAQIDESEVSVIQDSDDELPILVPDDSDQLIEDVTQNACSTTDGQENNKKQSEAIPDVLNEVINTECIESVYKEAEQNTESGKVEPINARDEKVDDTKQDILLDKSSTAIKETDTINLLTPDTQTEQDISVKDSIMSNKDETPNCMNTTHIKPSETCPDVAESADETASDPSIMSDEDQAEKCIGNIQVDVSETAKDVVTKTSHETSLALSIESNNDEVTKCLDIVNVEPTEPSQDVANKTNDETPLAPEAEKDIAATEHLSAKVPDNSEPQPSTSTVDFDMNKDTSNDVPDSDTLGLLAESTRVMDDDDDQDEDDDDDDDFYQDDESNMMAAEHSDDSNHQSDDAQEIREIVETDDKTKQTEIESTDVSMTGDQDCSEQELQTPEHREEGFKFTISDVTNDVQKDNEENKVMEIDVPSEDKTVVESNTDAKKEPEKKELEGTVAEPVENIEITEEAEKKSELEELASKPAEKETKSPSKILSLAISTQQAVWNFVDLEESSEDEIQIVSKPSETTAETKQPEPQPESTQPEAPMQPEEQPQPEVVPEAVQEESVVTSDIDLNVEVLDEDLLKVDDLQPTDTTEDATEISTLEKHEEISKVESQKQPVDAAGLEVFTLDSDEEDTAAPTAPVEAAASEPESVRRDLKCINSKCTSVPGAALAAADAATVAYYDGDKRRRALVCEDCERPVRDRNEELMEGIRNLTPLLELDMGPLSLDLVEISDSDSEPEPDDQEHDKDKMGDVAAKFLEDNLADMINETWDKYQMDSRLADTESVLQMELRRLEKESAQIQSFLRSCQASTDRLRNELYASFPQDIQQLPPLVIYDTPDQQYCFVQTALPLNNGECTIPAPSRSSKRRLEAAADSAAKRPAIPLGYTPLEVQTEKSTGKGVADEKIDDDNTDVSVVNIISSEAAPPGLPPPGELVKPPLKVGMAVYAMRSSFGSWVRGKIVEIMPKGTQSIAFTTCKVKFEVRNSKTQVKTILARCMAYSEPSNVRLTIGTRVIANFKDTKDNKDKGNKLAPTDGKRESFFSGIVAEVPNPVNKYRYLIFFDDGYAQYASHADTRLVCECASLVWEEVHPFSREFVREYLLAYPERPMVRLHPFQSLKTEWNGKWWTSRIVAVDASLAQVHFPINNRYEWIYRGSTRLAPLYLELQAAERHRSRPMPRAQALARANMPVVEYTRYDEQSNKSFEVDKTPQQQRQEAEAIRQRAVAKKSTGAAVIQPTPPARAPPAHNLDNVTSRVVYYTPKNAVKPHKMVPHTCGPKCKRADVLALKDLRTYNPLAKPLLSGWERQIVRYKGQKAVSYRAPCGRRVRNARELHRYLRVTRAELPVDLFDFSPATHCLAEFVLNRCLIMKKDLSQGKENVPVPCVNYYDESLPEFCLYNTERTPTAGVPLNLDPDFLCGCDCEDDCEDKSKCACWKLTLEGARTIGLEGDNVGYVYKRLPEPLPSGIYECNSRCKCKHTCLNRVAQHPLQLKLQIFKTLNRGWGIRALNDVPKGSFLCVYAGNLLTDATANLDGLNEGDEYLAELDYIEVVEQMKEGYEEDIPKHLKKLSTEEKEGGESESSSESESEEESKKTSKDELDDDDFQPAPHVGIRVSQFSKRLRQRNRNKEDKNAADDKKEGEKEKEKEKEESKKEGERGSNDEDCITISDDDEVREPSSFAAAAGMGANAFVSKYKSVRSLFGEDESCYIMDAKVQGNIGRYLNHSCSPNVFVQNVFVDTHDPRFPWVAFFALSHVRAGTELTWNYNYDVGSVPGKALYCYCGAPNCRGRLL